jgi:hypothetical protein
MKYVPSQLQEYFSLLLLSKIWREHFLLKHRFFSISTSTLKTEAACVPERSGAFPDFIFTIRMQAVFYYKTLEAFPADIENVLLI